MIDKFTYGRTPAAIYLAEQLNELDDPRLTRKVTRLLTSFNNVINELMASNEVGKLSAHTVGSFISMLRERAQTASYGITGVDPLVRDLLSNILTGKVKELQRRVMKVRHYEQRVAQYRQHEQDEPPRAKPLSKTWDEVTPDLLVKRSKARLARLGKRDELY